MVSAILLLTLSLGREWVISLTIFVSNLTVRSMNYHFSTIVLSNTTSNRNCLSLGGCDFGNSAAALSSDSPISVVRNYMLIFLRHATLSHS